MSRILDAKDFGGKCAIHTYKEMTHGFMCRGDVQKPEVVWTMPCLV